MIKLTIIGILACLLSLALLAVMDSDEPEVLPSKTYVVGGSSTSYVIGGEETDLFEKWQSEQGNKINQRKWDAYMGEDDE